MNQVEGSARGSERGWRMYNSLLGGQAVKWHASKDCEISVCEPDQIGRILKSDQSGRSFSWDLRNNVLPFRLVQGVRRVSVLSELKVGETGVLVALDLPESVQNHLMHMGFVPDALVTALRRAPAGDPTVYGIDGMEIALRHETADSIRVRPARSRIPTRRSRNRGKRSRRARRGLPMSACCETPAFEPPKSAPPAGALKTVVLIGPPNSGKSTLFNRLTGLRQKVANYPGVTVEQRMGLMAGVGRDDLTLIDLPGIYSLTPYSEDARVSIDVLRGKMPGTPKPDAVILVLDSLHLTRQLMLAAPVLAVGLPTLVLLNMSDLMESRGGQIDPLQLARELGAPVALISATHGTGLDAVPLFLHQQTEREAAKPLALPVLGNAASAHSWAAQVSRKTGYRAPLSQ